MNHAALSMRTSLLTIIAVTLAEATAAAQPGASVGEQEAAQDPRARAIQLTTEAGAAARAGHCDVVRTLEPQVEHLDPEVHDRAFTADPAIASCGHASPAAAAGAAHEGLAVGGALGLGSALQYDARVGWVISPLLTLFATGMWGAVLFEDDVASYRVLGIGARLSVSDRMFVDGRIGHARAVFPAFDTGASFQRTGVGYFAGIGFELLQLPSFGLELHAEYAGWAGMGGAGSILGGLGITFY